MRKNAEMRGEMWGNVERFSQQLTLIEKEIFFESLFVLEINGKMRKKPEKCGEMWGNVEFLFLLLLIDAAKVRQHG